MTTTSTMQDSHNLDKLSRRCQSLVAYMFEHHWVGWTLCYMVEVRLDKPLEHMLNGGDGLCVHGGNGSRHYATHYGDKQWAVVHVEDEAFEALNITATEIDMLASIV